MEVIYTDSFDGDINTIIIDSANASTAFEEKKQREKIKKNMIKKNSRKIRVGLNSLPYLFFMIE